MSRKLRDKEMKLYYEFMHLKTLTKEDKMNYKVNDRLYEEKEKTFKKYEFYRKFLEAKEKER